jgi:hypothetical protein
MDIEQKKRNRKKERKSKEMKFISLLAVVLPFFFSFLSVHTVLSSKVNEQ